MYSIDELFVQLQGAKVFSSCQACCVDILLDMLLDLLPDMLHTHAATPAA